MAESADPARQGPLAERKAETIPLFTLKSLLFFLSDAYLQTQKNNSFFFYTAQHTILALISRDTISS